MARSEPDELAGMPRTGRFLFTVERVEDGLSSLAGDAADKIHVVQVELPAFVVPQGNDPQQPVFDPDWRQQQRWQFEAKAAARFERFLFAKSFRHQVPRVLLEIG